VMRAAAFPLGRPYVVPPDRLGSTGGADPDRASPCRTA
jgi:hypothetical protein